MQHRKKLVIGGVVAIAVAAGTGVGVAVAGSDDGDAAATGPGADKATAAALALFPGGKANSVERDSENGATWEVEVTRADGGTVDVRLDDAYGLVVVEGDDENGDS